MVPEGSSSKPYIVTVAPGSGAGNWSRAVSGVIWMGTVVASAPGAITSCTSPRESLAVPPAGPMVVTVGSLPISFTMPTSMISPACAYPSRYARIVPGESMTTIRWCGGVLGGSTSGKAVSLRRNEPSLALEALTSLRGAPAARSS